jgi:hypothetical protein
MRSPLWIVVAGPAEQVVSCQRSPWPISGEERAKAKAKSGSAPIPDRWRSLGVPTENLSAVGDDTNPDRFVADYRDASIEVLTQRIDASLTAAG